MGTIKIHVLAVLRAAVEGKGADTYFGSSMSLTHWIAEAWVAGLITHSELANIEATDLGRRMYEHLQLGEQPTERAYLWPDATELVKKAEDWLLE